MKPAGNCFAPDLRHRPGQGCHRQGPGGGLSGQYHRGRFAGAPAPVLHPGGAGLPGGQGDPRDGGLRPPERHHGPALHQTRHPGLPEPPDLPDPGAPEKAHPAFSLQPQPRRRPLSGERRDDRHVHRSLRPRGRQGEDLPAARYRPRGQAHRVSLLLCRRDAGGARAGQGAEARRQPPDAGGSG